MSMTAANLLKKSSPSGEVTLYLGQRDFVDHFSQMDSVDGVVIVSPRIAYGRRLFVQILLHFRYAAESDEFADVSFKKTVCLSSCELYPTGERRKEIVLNKWQSGLFKKVGDIEGVCPFSMSLPQGAPPSLKVLGAAGVSGEPCGLTYEVVAFLSHDILLPKEMRNLVRLNIRVIQSTLPIQSLENLCVAPSSLPATLVSRQFLLSPGRIQIEMCLDKAVFTFGEKLIMNVAITNSSNKTIRKIKCKVLQASQMSFASGERRVALYCYQTQDGCPISPGSSLQKTYTLHTKLEPHRRKEGLVFQDPVRGLPTQLAPSTIFPYTDPREGFAILVSYVAKIKLCLGTVHGDVSAQVPFLMFHSLPDQNQTDPENRCKTAIQQPRMVRLISLDENERADDTFAW